MLKISNLLLPILLFIFAVLSGLTLYRSASFVQDKHFSLLANSFLHNDLFLSPLNLPDGDFVDFNSKQYLYFGPLPSLLLIPFVAFWGKNFPQMTLSITSLVATYLGVFLLARSFKFHKADSIWLANFFVFGTVLFFVGIVNISAYVVQAVGVAFIAFAILEYFGKRRWLLLGLLIGAAGAVRITLFGYTLFFLLELFRIRKDINIFKSLYIFLIPVILSIGILSLYNFRRFNSFFDTGYTKNVTNIWNKSDNHIVGYFSVKHIPANLYALFVMSPEPIKQDNVNFVLRFPYIKANGTGLAIWFTSPLFIYLLISKKKKYSVNAIIAIVVLAIPSLIYFGIGITQYGYRYSLDFLPLLFLLLLGSFGGKLPVFAKSLIFFGVIFNCIYMFSIWNSYPIFQFWKYY